MACLAQFYPKKYPDNFWLLAACVPAYVVLSSLMTGAGRRLGGRAAQWKCCCCVRLNVLGVVQRLA